MLGSVFNRHQKRQTAGTSPSVRCVLRAFTANKQSFPYSEYQGNGPPQADYGQPGDIYLDLTPDRMTLYGRHSDAWKMWNGPEDTTLTNLVCHPEQADRYLWCKADGYGWYARSYLIGSQGKTQSEVLSAAKERATLKSTTGRKRKSVAEDDPHNKKAHTSTSTSSTTAPNATQSGAEGFSVPNRRHSSQGSIRQTPESPMNPSPTSAFRRSSLTQTHSPPHASSLGSGWAASNPPTASTALPHRSNTEGGHLVSPRIETIQTTPTTYTHFWSSLRSSPLSAEAGPSRLPYNAPQTPSITAEVDNDMEEIDQLIDTDDPIEVDGPVATLTTTAPKPDAAAVSTIDSTTTIDPMPLYAPTTPYSYHTPYYAAEIEILPNNTSSFASDLNSSPSIPSLLDAVVANYQHGSEQAHAGMVAYIKSSQEELDRLRRIEAAVRLNAKELSIPQSPELTHNDVQVIFSCLRLAQDELKRSTLSEIDSGLVSAWRLKEANSELETMKEARRLDAVRLEEANKEISALKESNRLDTAVMNQATEGLKMVVKHGRVEAAKLEEVKKELAALKEDLCKETLLLAQANAEIVQLKQDARRSDVALKNAKLAVEFLKKERDNSLTTLVTTRGEVSRLNEASTTAATRLDQATQEIAHLKADAEKDAQRIKELEEERKELKAVEEQFVRVKGELAESRITAKWREQQLHEVEAEIAKSKEENEELRMRVDAKHDAPAAIATGESMAGDGGDTIMDELPNDNSMMDDSITEQTTQEASIDSTSSPNPLFVNLLKELHIYVFCVKTEYGLFCRLCLASDPEAIKFVFEEGPEWKDTTKRVHEHHVQEHCEDYECVINMSDEELSELYNEYNEAD